MTRVDTNAASTPVTDGRGVYGARYLNAGTYTVSAKPDGFKTFDLPRDMQLQIRVESINALNYTVLWNPSQDPRNARFGLVNQDRNNPRDFQLGARLSF